MAKEVSDSEHIKVCPCGGTLEYGSHDPCEGWAFWCSKCGFGPIWFDNPRAVPVHDAIDRADEPLEDIIDADEFNIRLRRGKTLRTFLHRSSGCVIEEVAL